jgi:hypothetical protein
VICIFLVFCFVFLVSSDAQGQLSEGACVTCLAWSAAQRQPVRQPEAHVERGCPAESPRTVRYIVSLDLLFLMCECVLYVCHEIIYLFPSLLCLSYLTL